MRLCTTPPVVMVEGVMCGGMPAVMGVPRVKGV